MNSFSFKELAYQILKEAEKCSDSLLDERKKNQTNGTNI